MKTVLITRAASGIGAHLMQAYANDPAYQVLAMNVKEIHALAGVGCLQVDLRDEQAVKQAFATIEPWMWR